MACLHGGRVPRLTELPGKKGRHSPPLHATRLTRTVGGLRGLSFERPLSTTNKMADQRNFLAASLIILSLIPLAASFQCIGMFICTLLIQRKNNSPRAAVASQGSVLLEAPGYKSVEYLFYDFFEKHIFI